MVHQILKVGGKHRVVLKNTNFMKKLRWDGTLYASGMVGWHNAVARWHVKCGTRRELGVYVINQWEELMRIPVPGVNGRIGCLAGIYVVVSLLSSS